MDRDLLMHLPVVAAVARHRSFAAAAAEMGLGPSAISHAVRLVEQHLGTPLFARTTRSVALTEAGHAFLARALPALNEIHEAAEAILADHGKVTGVLRINAPRIAMPLALAAVVRELGRRHPSLVVEVTSDDASIDIVAQGYDAGVRLGEMIAEDMVAVRLTPAFKAVTVASPRYLAAHGEPESLQALRAHNCIGYRLIGSGGTYDWEFSDKGKTTAIKVGGTARVTDSMVAVDLALEGAGIAYVFEPLVRDLIAKGKLRQVLAKYALGEPGLFAYFPRRALDAPKLRAFVEVVKDRLRLKNGA